MLKGIKWGWILILLLVNSPLFASGKKELNTSPPKVVSSQLGGDLRFLTFLSTDRPLYFSGEPVYIRALILEAASGVPYMKPLEATITILGPGGKVVHDDNLYADDNIMTYRWQIPPGMVEGEYTIQVHYSEYSHGFPPAERKVEILTYHPSRLKTEVAFLKEWYRQGEEVVAICRVAHPDGGVPAGGEVKISARVDDEVIHTGITNIDGAGRFSVAFKLPAGTALSGGTIQFAVQAGGISETVTENIPILRDSFSVVFYPEGGTLVSGVENRVYFMVLEGNGTPAEMTCTIIDDAGRKIVNCQTESDGRGSLLLTPLADKKYFLSLGGQKRDNTCYPLPLSREEGALLKAENPVLQPGETPEFMVFSNRQRLLKLVIFRREKKLSEKKLIISPECTTRVRMSLPGNVNGVLRATLWSGKTPLAERLIYRVPRDEVKISFEPAQAVSLPGERVKFLLKTTNAAGDPVGATLGIKVTDMKTPPFPHKRDNPPLLPAMFFLENEVMHLVNGNVYVNQANPEAGRQLDLLLGTQGWRYSAFTEWDEFLAFYGDKARRLAAQVRVIEPEPESGYSDLFHMVLSREKPLLDMASPDQPLTPFDEEIEVTDSSARMGLLPLLADGGTGAVASVDDHGSTVQPGEYVHKRVTGGEMDFLKTVYWNAALSTDPVTGKAEISFRLNDSITSYQIAAEAFTPGGVVGAGTLMFDAVKPLSLEPAPPPGITGGDPFILPLVIVNTLAQPLAGELTVKLEDEIIFTSSCKIAAGSRTRKLIQPDKQFGIGEHELSVLLDCGAYKDNVTCDFRINAPGIPIVRNNSGIIGHGEPFNSILVIPDTVYPDTLHTEIQVYPSPPANMSQALEVLRSQPHGNFESFCSMSYLQVLIQRYYLGHHDVDPDLIRRGRENLKLACKRLKDFECRSGGYEWFGSDPGDEVLTAYALMMLIEMKEVMDVDQGLIERTEDWLLGRRDGKGGFLINHRVSGKPGAIPEDTANAFILWALLESGQQGLQKEIDFIRGKLFSSGDSYLMALGANMLFDSGDSEGARRLMNQLRQRQHADGYITGAACGITPGGGLSLVTETTALGMLAWLKDPVYAENVENALKFLAEQCLNGYFHSTQGTISASKAIMRHAELHSNGGGAGSLQLLVNGVPCGDPLSLPPRHPEAVTMPDFAAALTPGRHTITLAMEGAYPMQVSSRVSFNIPLMDKPENGCLELNTVLSDTRIHEGAETELIIKVKNTGSTAVSMPVAVIGIPGGVDIRRESLRELIDGGKVASCEILDGKLILYWRLLEADEIISFPVRCCGHSPGEYTAQASHIYEYYTPENRYGVAGTRISIRAFE